ncbi:basic form of pathogenesis-related protein 1-like [Cucurbita maxima]|uniref:Basic form of pathogenesis-related protein 1-like n=1 Tax=Cucurbita maxima TaxID=3661 RepID=A0A6J1I7Z4_CUCMA|nr:basic form of pathogenesis-related protein 1-like [Cucurbita maxima]
MQWSNTVAAYAQAYAEKTKGDCAMIYSTGPYGENIAAGYYPEFTGADAVKLWANEKPLYDHASNKCVGGECGHFTKMAWRSSVRLGCARVPCKPNSQFVVWNYDLPGNYIGEKPYDSWVSSKLRASATSQLLFQVTGRNALGGDAENQSRYFQPPNQETHDDGD